MLICIPPYMHKSLPTLGNETEQQQIKVYEKIVGRVDFLAGDLKSQNVLFHLPNWASAQKVR